MSQGVAPHKSLFGCRSIKVLVFVLNLTLYLFYKQFLRNEMLMLEILLLFAYISLSLSLYIYLCVCVIRTIKKGKRLVVLYFYTCGNNTEDIDKVH